MTDYAAHPDYLALLAGVLHAPDDDLPRLTLADWLAEHGQHEYAEFIQVQCEIGGSFAGNCPQCGKTWERLHLSSYPAPMAFCRRCRELGPYWPLAEREVALRNQERELWADLASAAHDGDGLLWGLPASEVTVPSRPGIVYPPASTVYTVSRGFVAAIRLPLAAFIIWVCERCDGTRLLCPTDYDSFSGHFDPPGPGPNDCAGCGGTVGEHIACPDCSGTGRVEGAARAIFSRMPVVSVTLTDRVPAHRLFDGLRPESGGEWWWSKWLDWNTPDAPMHWLPAGLFDRLPGGRPWHEPLPPTSVARCYDTEAAANAALSVAAVAWGRELAGLPPLPSRTP